MGDENAHDFNLGRISATDSSPAGATFCRLPTPRNRDEKAFKRLEPTTSFRFELRGALPAFPAVHGYYIGLGVIDRETFEPMDVEQVLLSGPQTVTSAETLRFQ